MTRAPNTRRRLAAAAALLVFVVAGAACGNDPAAPPSPPPSSGPTHTDHGAFSPPAAEPLRAGERFVTLTLPQPYIPVAPNGGTDEYRCFLVDPALSAKAYLTGSQFLPQNADIVHHAIFFKVPPDTVAEARQVDARSPGEGWQCFGDAGVSDQTWVAHWAPGANEVLLREGLGYEMPPGSQLVMQVHYNLLATEGKLGSSDRSSVRLRIADGSAPMTALRTLQLPAPIELPCTASESGPLCDRAAAVKDVTTRFGAEVGGSADLLLGWCGDGKPAPGPTQHCDHTIERAATIHAAAGHMHLLGRSIKIELNPGKPGAKVLLDVPRYNFDDQAIRPLTTPVDLHRGDVVRVTCTHDAALRAMLPQLRQLPPRYVVWGDGTADEMCLGLLVGTTP